MSLFDNLLEPFTGSGGKRAAEEAAAARSSGIKSGYNKAIGFLDEGLGQARTTYERAASPFQQFIDMGVNANNAYGDALGLNGQEGYTRAVDTFHANPGYQFQVDQANEAVKRNASATGMLGSGNTLAGIADRTRSLADTEYQQYLDNLFRGTGSGQTAAQGQASVLSNLASAELGTGDKKADLGWTSETGIGNSNAQLAQDKYAADSAAASNLWSAVFGIAGIASRFGGAGSVGGDVALHPWTAVAERA